MTTPYPDAVTTASRCPRCRGSLEARADGFSCPHCDVSYPTVAGIPDFRVSPDPWLGFEDDRNKARRLEAATRGSSFADTVRAYWKMTPSTPPDAAERFVTHVLTAERRTREWLERLGTSGASGFPPGPWLDLGCGTADLAAAAGRRVVGIDVALRWLVVARRRLEEAGVRAELVCCNAEHLPFADATFAGAFSLGMVEHCRNPEAVFREAVRVLESGAPLVLRTVNRYTILREPHVGVWGVGFLPRRWAGAYVRRRTGGSYRHHRPLGPAELGGAMRRGGLRDIEVVAAPILEAEVGRLGRTGRWLAPIYRVARSIPGARLGLRAFAPLLEARGRAP